MTVKQDKAEVIALKGLLQQNEDFPRSSIYPCPAHVGLALTKLLRFGKAHTWQGCHPVEGG